MDSRESGVYSYIVDETDQRDSATWRCRVVLDEREMIVPGDVESS